MGAVGGMLIFLSSSLCLYLLLALFNALHKLWWIPNRIQTQMDLQGIRGPSYRFFHGNTKEVLSLKKEAAMNRPINLSHDILSRVQPHIHSWLNIYGNTYLQWEGSKAQVITTEPGLIKETLNNRDGEYHKLKTEAYIKKLIGDGLVTAEGEKWAKLRKLANYSLHAERLKNMIPAMTSSVEVMLDRWKRHEGKEIDVYKEFTHMTSEVISRTAFGSSYLDGEKIFQILTRMTLISVRNIYKIKFPVISKFYKTEDEIESEKLEKGLRDSILAIVKKREEKVMTEKKASFGDDFLGLLVKAHHDADANKKISVEDLVDECKTLYLAGQETTNGLLAWTVFLLAIHTEWQEEARKEVLKIFGQQNPNPDGITKLKTISMIIHESLRLYPPVVGFTRRVDSKVRLGNLTLPPNLVLYIPTIAVHHNPEIWGEDVHLFKPERFSEGVAKATNNNIAAVPFGMGSRNCVGLNFATYEAKIALSMILQRYSFTLSPAYVHSPVQHLTLRPQHGVQVMLHSL